MSYDLDSPTPPRRSLFPITKNWTVAFEFLASIDATLYELAQQAVRLCPVDAPAAVVKLRIFGESLARSMADAAGLPVIVGEDHLHLLNRLKIRGFARTDLTGFHELRRAGNAAAHENKGDVQIALKCIDTAYTLAVRFVASRALPVSPGETPTDSRQENLLRELPSTASELLAAIERGGFPLSDWADSCGYLRSCDYCGIEIVDHVGLAGAFAGHYEDSATLDAFAAAIFRVCEIASERDRGLCSPCEDEDDD